MHKITVGWMYPNLLNLNGERGSVQALVEIGKQLGIDVEILRIEDFDDAIPFESIDLLMFLPGEITTLRHIVPSLESSDLGNYLEHGGYALALGTTDNTHLAHFQNINTSHIAKDRHIDYFSCRTFRRLKMSKSC